MAYTFRRAFRSMLFTSCTTALAFFSNYFSPLMVFQSLGLFAATIVIVDFYMAVIVYPTAIMIYEQRIKMNWRDCRKVCKKTQDGPPKNSSGGPTLNNKIEAFLGGKFNNFIHKYRYFIILVFLVWTGLSFGFYSINLSKLDGVEEYIPRLHPRFLVLTIIYE